MKYIKEHSCLYLLKKDGKYKENISDLSGIFQKTSYFSYIIINNFIFFSRCSTARRIFAKFYVFVAVLEKEMYALAIIGLLTTVMSAFYYLKIIKIIYFDDALMTLESTKNRTVLSFYFW